jgi:hypothetical protein
LTSWSCADQRRPVPGARDLIPAGARRPHAAWDQCACWACLGAVLDGSYGLLRRDGRLVTLGAPPDQELAARYKVHDCTIDLAEVSGSSTRTVTSGSARHSARTRSAMSSGTSAGALNGGTRLGLRLR